MKKIITILVMLLSFTSFSQEIQETQEQLLQRIKDETELKLSKKPFTFDRIVLNKMEKKVLEYSESIREPYITLSPLLEDNTYYDTVKISSFNPTDKFVYTNKFENRFHSSGGKQVIKNVNSGKYYVIYNQAAYWQDYGSNATPGHKDLIKYAPYVPTVSEQELINKYKLTIKNAKLNMVTLRNIQNKCLTKWAEFDPSKMSSVDKQTWNKTIVALKNKQKLLHEFNDLDSKNIARDRLTMNELFEFDNIAHWVSNFQTF